MKKEKRNNIYIYIFSTSVHIVLKMERYCSRVLKFIEFRTPHENDFLVFGVSNTKYLTFSTPNKNALRGLFINQSENSFPS